MQSFQTTMTSKGQVTIPAQIRKRLKTPASGKFQVVFDPATESVVISAQADYFTAIKKLKLKPIDPVKARDYMNEHYER